MHDHHLEPALTVVTILGGIVETAKAAGVHRTRVNRWLLPKERGGTGGLVPSGHHQPLLDWAKAHGKKLEPEHFFARPVSVSKRRGATRVAA